METEGLDFGAALESLAERYRVVLERESEDPREAETRQRRERLYALLERTAAYYVRVLWEAPAAEDARAYLASRGLEEAALRAYRVGYAPDAWDKVVVASRKAGYSEAELVASGLAQRSQRGTLIDRFRGRVTFPLADERGRVLGFGARAMKPDDKPKYLNTSENDLFHKGRIVYGADMARAAAARAGRVVLVEGYTDVIALHQAGVPESVAQMGTALTDAQVDAIARLAPKALFCQDPDRAGQESVAKGIAALRTHNKGRATKPVEFRIVRLPTGADPADVVQTSGAEAMRALLEEAVAIERFEVERALEQPGASTDEMLAAVAPVISSMPENVLRAELVALVADRLGLGTNLVNESLKARAGGRAHRRSVGRSAAGSAAAACPAAVATPAASRRRAADHAPRAGPRPSRATPAAPEPAPARPKDPFADGAPPPEWDGFSGEDADPGALGPPPPDWAAAPPPAAPAPAPPHEWARMENKGGRHQRGNFRGGGRDRDRFRRPDPPPEPADPRAALARREQHERAFLAFCIALPDEGEARLAGVDLDDYFSSPGTRQAADYLRGRLRAPLANLPAGEEGLAHLVAELVVRSGTLEATPGKLELEALQLDLHRLERHISSARITGAGGVSELAHERQRVLDEIRHRLT